MAKTTHTKVKGGYRWELTTHVESPAFCNWTGLALNAQQRCTTDSGRVYYRYVGEQARFDNEGDRQVFLSSITARAWADGSVESITATSEVR